MIKTTQHEIVPDDSRNMDKIPDESVDLIVTSPPYPMISMWDPLFGLLNPDITLKLEAGLGKEAFELMHLELDKVWKESFRVLKKGGICCINIGDAVRTINERFSLYPNHSRILQFMYQIGYNPLPLILWRKQTNAPNKFMGSGMLPAGAYVTLEHEYILVFRKGDKRVFKTKEDKLHRRNSSFFWEERNIWFSDLWDFKGIPQKLQNKESRKRSGAYPFELAYRLINMYSLLGDTVLDPFLGTGTTTIAAMSSERNSIGFEISPELVSDLTLEKNQINRYINARISNHIRFSESYIKKKGSMKHQNSNFDFPVVTLQEKEILINLISTIENKKDTIYSVSYEHFSADEEEWWGNSE